MSKKTQHVVRNPDGRWAVKKGGSSRATKVYETQEEAIVRGEEIARTQNAAFYIHGRDGRIRTKRSFRNDPNPPKSKNKR